MPVHNTSRHRANRRSIATPRSAQLLPTLCSPATGRRRNPGQAGPLETAQRLPRQPKVRHPNRVCGRSGGRGDWRRLNAPSLLKLNAVAARLESPPRSDDAISSDWSIRSFAQRTVLSSARGFIAAIIHRSPDGTSDCVRPVAFDVASPGVAAPPELRPTADRGDQGLHFEMTFSTEARMASPRPSQKSNSLGNTSAPVPNHFAMNFQAVSVAQDLPTSSTGTGHRHRGRPRGGEPRARRRAGFSRRSHGSAFPG
jgi:hypothetical protein